MGKESEIAHVAEMVRLGLGLGTFVCTLIVAVLVVHFGPILLWVFMSEKVATISGEILGVMLASASVPLSNLAYIMLCSAVDH